MSHGLVLRNPRTANVLDAPSMSLPIPVAGLSVALMLIGRRNSDRQLLSAAERFVMRWRSSGRHDHAPVSASLSVTTATFCRA